MDILLFLLAFITFIIVFVYMISLESVSALKENLFSIIFFMLMPISTSIGFLTLMNSDRVYSIEHDDSTTRVTISNNKNTVDGITTETTITKIKTQCHIQVTAYIPATSPMSDDDSDILIHGSCEDVIDNPKYNSIIEKLKIP